MRTFLLRYFIANQSSELLGFHRVQCSRPEHLACRAIRKWLFTIAVSSMAFGFGIFRYQARAQNQEPRPSPGALKKLSVEELMDLEVTLVSKRPEKLSEAASAIQVITGEDIRRSGAMNLADALRLAAN